MEIWIHNCRVQLFSKQQIQELRMCSRPLTFYLRLDYDSWIKQVSKGLSSIVVLWLHLQLLKYWIMCTYTFLQGWSPYRLEELGMTFGDHIKHTARSQAFSSPEPRAVEFGIDCTVETLESLCHQEMTT